MFARPYRHFRREGDSRWDSLKRARGTRRSNLGPRGWLPTVSYMSVEHDPPRDWPEGIKQYRWRGKTVWRDRKAERRQEAEAIRRYEALPSDEEVRRWAETNPPAKFTDAQMAHAKRFAHEMGWDL
jgi:hypothetical protein